VPDVPHDQDGPLRHQPEPALDGQQRELELRRYESGWQLNGEPMTSFGEVSGQRCGEGSVGAPEEALTRGTELVARVPSTTPGNMAPGRFERAER